MIKNRYKINVGFLLTLGGILFLSSCLPSTESSRIDHNVKLYIDTVVHEDIIENNVILKGNAFSSKADVPAVHWINKSKDPSKWLLLMYKRGSNSIYFSSLVDGSLSSKTKGVADYVNKDAFSINVNFPVEYRISLTRIETADWSINKDNGTITVKGAPLTKEVTLDRADQIYIARSGEKEFSIRVDGKNSLDKFSAKAGTISKEKLSGLTVGIPLIKMPRSFILTSSSLVNGAKIENVPPKEGSSTDSSFKHSSGNCSGYIGHSVSPALEWSGRKNASTSSYVVLAYNPVQKNPKGGLAALGRPATAPYSAFWFQYNIPAGTTSLDEGAGGNGNEHKGTEEETSKTNPLFHSDYNEASSKYTVPIPIGKFAQNVYSLATSELLKFYNSKLCYPESDSDTTTLATRLRYDGPLPYPYGGRHYMRYIVFEVDASNITVFKDASLESIKQNKKESISEREELKEFGFEFGISGSAVDKLVRNFVDVDRTKIRNNDFTNLNVQDKNGTIKILRMSVLIFSMDAPSVPF